MTYCKLPREQEAVIVRKETERPFAEKNTPHSVNSFSLDFVPATDDYPMERAIFASGCFWGTEYYFRRAKGVISTTAGYTGGWKDNPSYEEVCSGATGHAEALEVLFDPRETSYEELARLFFETHDPTQLDRQGPDIGKQYRSAIFYVTEEQKRIADKLIEILRQKGINVATEVKPATTFWKADDYHQDYYRNRGGVPYCHRHVRRF
jgi:peptide methionine sulfoxide reductase msrA/msrB